MKSAYSFTLLPLSDTVIEIALISLNKLIMLLFWKKNCTIDFFFLKKIYYKFSIKLTLGYKVLRAGRPFVTILKSLLLFGLLNFPNLGPS